MADIRSIRRDAVRAGLTPPPRLTLSAWADAHFRLSAESAAEPGRWKTLPYQRAILDAITDPTVTHVSVMKSARVGYTLMVSAAMGYYIHQAPAPILVVMPTVEDSKNFSKETIAPMLRDVPVLSRIVFEDAEDTGPRDGGQTLQHKKFPGGVLSLVGANSGSGFRRVSRKVVIFDEVDGYPASAGSDGDPIKLGTMRSQAFWDRKIIAGSTPLVAGASRIERLFEEGDQRRYFVPCPQCGHMAPLVFSGEHGHSMKWPEDRPEEAYFACQANGCVIEYKDQRTMVAAGEWRAAAPFTGHASFHLWAALGYSPNSTWGHIAKEFLEAKGNTETLRTFVNTVLGETWKERGDAPDWERLYQRREGYALGTVPAGVKFLTAGVDVQKDRFVYEVVGWAPGKESWSIDIGVIPADTANEAAWAKLDELLGRTYPTSAGTEMAVHCLAVDSGYNTNAVYSWARRHPMDRVIATKGVTTARTLIGSPTAVDVTLRGKRIARGAKVWPVGVDVAKSELYGWLRLPAPEDGASYPPGFCHFPEYGADYFKQLTAEHLVPSVTRQGFTKLEWQMIPGRENHYLDCRVYARAAAVRCGLERMRTPPRPPSAPAAAAAPTETPAPPPPAAAPRPPPKPRASGGFLSKGADRFPISGKKSWLR